METAAAYLLLTEAESLAYRDGLVNFCVRVSAGVTANYFAGFQAFGKANENKGEIRKNGIESSSAGGTLLPLPLIVFPYSPFSSEGVLPLHGPFLRRINLRLFGHWQRLAKQKSFDVIEEKVLGVGTGEVQTVMIDYLRLLLKPGGPARLADLFGDSLSQFVREGRKANRRSLLVAVFAFDVVRH